VLQGKGYNDVHVSTIDIPNEPKDAIGAEQGTLQAKDARGTATKPQDSRYLTLPWSACAFYLYTYIYTPTTPAQRLGLTINST